MDSTVSRRSSVTAWALLGTASFLTLAGTAAAQAQANAPAVEEVLVTGSLIRGAPAVGVPVTALSDQDFRETGALTLSDALKSVPSVTVAVQVAVTNPGGTIEKPQTVAVHNISTGSGVETLLMFDGIRFPIQGFATCYIDPSIVPQLAVDHIDVLADGASATYGSDAVAGVINVLLKHGFEGAISQVRYAQSWDIGASNYQATQLYGTKWNSGDVTVSYEWYHEDVVHGPARDYFTLNFEPYGYDNKTGLGVSMPGVVSTGALQGDPNLTKLGFSQNSGERTCVNCYSIPAGTGWNYGDTAAHTNPTTPTPTTSWTTLLANQGVKNLRNPASDADVLPAQDHNSATITFDQDLMYGVRVFGEAFYSNRRTSLFYLPGASPAAEQALRAVPVPSTNPYYPSGAPAGLRISYDLGVEHNSRVATDEVAGRYAFGLQDDQLPFDWHGRIYYSMNEDLNFVHVTGMINSNMVLAALGNTVGSIAPLGSTPGQAAFTKPANVPYLNLFCDATQYQCNSPITEAYIGAFRNYDEHWLQTESGINLDGPITELPGGTLRAALGANIVSYHYEYDQHSNFGPAPNTSVLTVLLDPEKRALWAMFGQLSVPIVGEANKLPLVEALDIEVAARYDRYYSYGGVTTPKLAATWKLGYGLSLRGTVGKSFRAPFPGEYSPLNGAMIQPLNTAAGASQSTVSLNCPSVPGLSTGGTANPGSLNAYLDPTCSSASPNYQPGIIGVSGTAGAASAIRTGSQLGPERAKNWALGFNFAPTDFLKGLNVDLTWYNFIIDDVIDNNGEGVNFNDPEQMICTTPTTGCQWIVRANPNLPLTDPANAEFQALVTALVNNPRSSVPLTNVSNIQVIEDTAVINVDYREIEGLDFDTRYDFDLGEWGAWNAGFTGNYQLIDKSRALPTLPVESAFSGNTGGHLRWRGRLGWTASEGDFQGLSITGFVNYIPHGPVATAAPPPCFWAPGFSAGSCYPGSPYWGPYNVFPNTYPGLYTFDLSLGYQTGTMPANEYLQNINFQFTVNDLFNKAPPFDYASGSGRGLAGYISAISPLQRYVSFAITKAW